MIACYASPVPAATPAVRRVHRTDLSTLQPVEERDDGTIVADARLTRCGVFAYYQPDGSVRRELRRKQDVCDSKSLHTLIGRPVTNNHPPGLLDAKTARDWMVGAQAGDVTVDEDHVRSKVSVLDATTIGAMRAGKVEVSCGYECDCLETPGEDPVYGKYDAVQTNIRYNHIAIVDKGRAGPTATVRMDGWMVAEPVAGRDASGTELASPARACNPRSMAKRNKSTARVEVVVRADEGAGGTPDPDDEASRNAAGENDASKAPKTPAAEGVEHDDDDADGDGDAETEMDAYDAMYDDEGCLTPAASARMKASNFAVPDKEQLPIHDKAAVKGAIKKFPEHPFDDADAKHAAFNRIVSRAKQFGVPTTGFQAAHGAKLDRAAGPRSDISMTAEEIKKLQARAEKSDARKNARDEARTRADAAEAKVKELEGKVAGLEGQVTSLTKDLETAKKGHLDSAAIDKIVAERAGLLAVNHEFGVPKFDALDAPEVAALTPADIKRAFIKHHDKEDVPADKHPEFIEALYQGALKRARKDAAATQAGANALAAARGTGGANTPTVVTPPAPGTGGELPSEAEVAARTRNDSINAWNKPGNAAALRAGGY